MFIDNSFIYLSL